MLIFSESDILIPFPPLCEAVISVLLLLLSVKSAIPF